MRQQAQFWSYFIDESQSHVQMGMRRMRLVAQGVDHKQITIAIEILHFRRHITKISGVTNGFSLMLEPQARRSDATMWLINIAHGNISDFHCAFERVSLANRGIMVMALEGIGKAPLQALERKWTGVTGDRLSGSLKNRPQIINSVTMIGMIMGPDHRVDPVYPVVQKLVAQIGGCIDQYPGGGTFNQN